MENAVIVAKPMRLASPVEVGASPLGPASPAAMSLEVVEARPLGPASPAALSSEVVIVIARL